MQKTKLLKGIFMLPLALSLSLSAQEQTIKQKADNSQVLDVVEQMPQYPGGDKALFKFLQDNVKYPVVAMEQNVQGTVIVRFVVRDNGNVDRAEVIRSAHPALDAEALRVVNRLSTWIPGKQKGQNVSVWFTLPIRFQLPGVKPAGKPLVLLDGMPLPAGFDLKALKLQDFNLEVKRPETEAIRASLIEKYGPEAANGVVFLTSKDPEKTRQLLSDLNISLKTSEKEEIVDGVDKPAQFPGGDKALFDYLSKSIRYPAEAQAEGISGMVQMEFVVSSTGKISKPKVVKGKHLLLNREAMRVISSMPDWIPAQKGGRNVGTLYTLPVKFHIEN